MPGTLKPVPEGYHALTPYLFVHDAQDALAFYAHVFGARETLRIAAPDGRIEHAEMTVGDCVFMLSDENPKIGAPSPRTVGGTAVGLLLYVANVDEVFGRAVAAGAEPMKPVADQFYGDRTGTVRDPFGHQWTVATHVEDVPPEEIARRAKAYSQG